MKQKPWQHAHMPAEGGCESADLNQDDVVNIFDLAMVGLNYGKMC